MRTPEEIKNLLKNYNNFTYNLNGLFADSLTYIEKLERERDAAVADMKDATLCGCFVCGRYYQPDPAVREYACRKFGSFKEHDFISDDGSMFCGAFVWRGPQGGGVMIERKTVSQCATSDYCKGWNDAVDALSKWISVEERLPDVCDLVLVIANGKPRENIILNNAVLIASFWGDEGWIADSFDGWDKLNVSHWMPLPELPMEDNDA